MQPEPLKIHCQCRTDPGGRPLVGILIEAGVSCETAYGMECPDVHMLAVTYARSRALTRMERELVAEIPARPLPTPTWLQTHRYVVVAAAFWFAVALVFVALWSVLT